MHIEQLVCENYRSFGESTLFTFSAGLNILIGHNNAGKTNFIRAFEFLINRFNMVSHLSVEQVKINDSKIHLEIVVLSSNINKKEFYLGQDNLPIKISLVIDIAASPNFRNFLLTSAKEHPNKDFIVEEKEIDRMLEGKKKIILTFRTITVESQKASQYMSPIGGTVQQPTVAFEPTGRFDFSKIFNEDFGYGYFKKFLSDNLLSFQEFRVRPNEGDSNLKISTSGSKLNSVIYNLKNSMKGIDQKKFDRIKDIFHKTFEVNIFISRGSNLEFYNVDSFHYDSEGIGGGLIEFLNVLTHLIAEEKKVFVIDEPELHLHPHNKRVLRNFLNKYSKNNQIIIITHSSDLIDPIDIEKVTLLRLVNNKTELSRFDKNLKKEPYMQRTLLRLNKTEQKEFLFAKKVLLVEGQTEQGSIPIFANKLNLDFDQNSISIIPIENNYFVGIIKLLKEFRIPSLILYDIDVLLRVTDSLFIDKKKIRTSSFFKQIDEVWKLNDENLEILCQMQSKIILKDSKKDGIPLLKEVLKEIRSPAMTKSVEGFIKSSQQSVYDDSLKRELLNLVNKVKPDDVRIEFLDPDFEGVFCKDFPDLYQQATKTYKSSKILQGYYLAKKIDKSNIPSAIRMIIQQLREI